jgi:DNA-binding HxlR family transcriptional regulator
MTSRNANRYARPYTCPVRLTLDVVGGKWKSHILWELRNGARGFNALLTAVTGISHKVLTQQLRQLERDGLIERRVRATRARRTDYALTPFGGAGGSPAGGRYGPPTSPHPQRGIGWAADGATPSCELSSARREPHSR